jgi:hypothetical protein
MYGTTAAVGSIAALASLIPAVLSYRFVEQPIRTRQWWPSGTATAWIAAACVVAPFAAGSGLDAAANRSWWRSDIADIRARVAPQHLDLSNNCVSGLPLGANGRSRCLWDVPSSSGTVLLIGDSNAGHLSEPFVRAAGGLGYSAQIATFGNCPFVTRTTYGSAWCRTFVEGSAAAIERRSPAYAAVVISNATMGYLGGPSAAAFAADAPADAPPGPAADREHQILGWVTSLRRMMASVMRSSPVVVIGAIPQFYNVPLCLRPTLFSRASSTCGALAAENSSIVRRRAVVSLERAAVLSDGGVYLDLGDRLCDAAGNCSAFVERQLVYRDGAHLSVQGAMMFEPDFRRALAKAVGR